MLSSCTLLMGHIDVCGEAELHAWCCVMFVHCSRWLGKVGDEGLKAVAATNWAIQHLVLKYDVVRLYLSRGSR